jgi:outer membrane protein assembly factor BamB
MNLRTTWILALLLCGELLFSQDLVQWRGPNRDGKYPGTDLLKVWPETGPSLLWHFEGLGEGHASATVTGSRIYTAGTLDGTGYVFCLSADGKLVWKVPYGPEWVESWPGSRSTPLYYKGKLYLVSGFGNLVCLDAASGKLHWKADLLKEYNGRNIQWGITENLLVEGNKLFCTPGGTEHNIIALDPDTGKLIWSSPGNGEPSAYCSPALIRLPARTILVTHTASSILGIDTRDGKLLWRHPQPNKYSVHANTPCFQNGYLYCVSGYGQGGILMKISADGSVKQEIWRNTDLDYRMGGFIILDGFIYGADDSNDTWYCVDWKTGKTMFSGKISGRGNIIYADGMLYCYGDTGKISLVRPTPAGFQVVSTFAVPYGEDQHWAHLVISNGRLYVRHGNSLMAYDIKEK